MISVVMPAYNASPFIASAIESILSQTFRDFELIIVDDGSTDNTREIVKGYVELDRRVRLIQNNHGGLCQTINAGINESRYPWVARMDADDIALPERFEKQLKAVNDNNKLVVLGTYAHHINSKGEVLSLIQQGWLTEEEFHTYREEGHLPFVIHPTALMKKDTLLKVGGYDPRFKAAEDFELFERMANYGLILAIPEPLLLYRVHSQSFSMHKFFAQKLFTKYVITRYRNRIAGNKEPDLEQFIEESKRQPALSRIAQHVPNLGQFWYRKAGLLFAEKQYLQAGLYLSMAIASNPSYSIPRVWRQKLSPEARRGMKGSESLGDGR